MRTLTPLAISTVTNLSSTAKIFPRMPLEVSTSSPFFSAASITCCSFCCFC